MDRAGTGTPSARGGAAMEYSAEQTVENFRRLGTVRKALFAAC
jgi:hypothetical protein